MSEVSLPQPTETNSLTVGQILSLVRLDAWKILLVTFVVTGGASVYSFLAPETWRATIQVVPTEVPQVEQLGALAAVLSKKAGSGSANIDLFSSLLVSREVLESLLSSKVTKPGTGKDSIFSVRYLLKVDSLNEGSVYGATKALSREIKFVTQQNTLSNIVEVSVTASNPWLAKGMLDNLLRIGQESLFEITRSRYTAVIHRLKIADSIAQQLSFKASDEFTRFQEGNRSGNLPSISQRLERLRQEANIRNQTYMMVRQELEQNLLSVEKIMPAVVQIDSSFVPPQRESPKRKVIILAGFILSSVASMAGFLAMRIYLSRNL